ncbi:MAG TPA: hypothetical protein VMV10_14875 [Pirellulales bacterium]|nr:hypothetical protein [Pirellulales bacterium]
MGLPDFLQALFEHGRVRVAAPDHAVSTSDWSHADAVLAERHAGDRAEFPGVIPPLDRAVAHWAAEQFYRACQFAVYRDAGADRIAATLNAPCPQAPAASRHVSVDLTFRFLPDLHRLASAASQDDPLCQRLRGWAADWPLSSVGMANVNPADIGDVLEHAGLRGLYVDRIIARRDRSRLSDPRLKEAVQAALGAFSELAADLADALTRVDEPNG